MSSIAVIAIIVGDFLVLAIISLLLQEIIRIRNEHPDDSQCIVNDRVKGRLKVTRAFGAGFLKKEVVSNVESFMEKFPDGDPTQYLIEELLFHAADKAGKMFFLLCLFL
ncbi:hypothetical protein Patl1_29371 [Pistacia atlantica]|uniref:Uncharacterized protein n=1 Tax=Pistacia atlantica TaxID=434234 RepID=A0ACC1ABC3_9ROSI|nr:hypothetical protein Patl1_29371 [Pistacia atlantica]